MFCTSCGKEVPADKSFCTSCGAPAPIPDDQPTAPTQPVSPARPVAPFAPVMSQPAMVQPTQQSAPVQPPRKGRGPVIFAVVLVLLIIIAGAVAAVLLLRNDDSTSSATTLAGANTTAAGGTATTSPGVTTAGGGTVDLVDLSTRADDIVASSTLADQGSTTYGVDNLLDRDPSTCWAEGVAGYGIHDYVDFTWTDPVTVYQIRIIPGYDKKAAGWDRWTSNGRVRTFDLVFDDGTRESFTVTDTRPLQTITLSAPRTTTLVEFVITGVYEAAAGPHKAEDTSVAELHFWGTE